MNNEKEDVIGNLTHEQMERIVAELKKKEEAEKELDTLAQGPETNIVADPSDHNSYFVINDKDKVTEVTTVKESLTFEDPNTGEKEIIESEVKMESVEIVSVMEDTKEELEEENNELPNLDGPRIVNMIHTGEPPKSEHAIFIPQKDENGNVINGPEAILVATAEAIKPEDDSIEIHDITISHAELLEQVDLKNEQKTPEEYPEGEKKTLVRPKSNDDIEDVDVAEIEGNVLEKDFVDVEFKDRDFKALMSGDFKDKSIFGGQSEYNFVKNKQIDEEEDNIKILKSLRDIKKKDSVLTKRFIDVYLPMTNIVLRVFEFYNSVIQTSIRELLGPDLVSHNINLDNSTNDEFLNKILVNSEVRCVDGYKISTQVLKEKISNSDIEVLKFAVGILMQDEDDKRILTFDDVTCEKCYRKTSYKFDMNKALTSVYTDENINHATMFYSYEKTFDELLKSSLSYKGKAVTHIFKSVNAYIRITLTDPNYDRAKRAFNNIYGYLVPKYSKYLSDMDKGSDFYKLTMKERFNHLNDYLPELRLNEMTIDLIKLSIMSYIRSFKVYNNVPDELLEKNLFDPENNRELEKYLDTEHDFINGDPSLLEDALESLDDEIHEKMRKAMEAIRKNHSKMATVKFVCADDSCKHENELPLDGTSLMGFLIMRDFGYN